MKKNNTLLSSVRSAARDGSVTKRDLLQAFEEGAAKRGGASLRHLTIAEVLSYLGGLIIFIGIGVLVWQHWDALNSFSRVLVTLGSGIAAYVSAVLLQTRKSTDTVSQALFFLSALLLPMGLAIVFYEANVQYSGVLQQTLISFLLFAFFVSSCLVFKRTLLLVFAVLYGTWFYFAFTAFIADKLLITFDQYYDYALLLAGVSYLLLGRSFQIAGKPLVGFLYGTGSVITLTALLALGGWSPEQHMVWELLFPAIALGFCFLGVHMRERSFLVFGSLYLMIYILKITGEYFRESLGWPLALVIAGLSLIGVGYGTVLVGRKYLRG